MSLAHPQCKEQVLEGRATLDGSFQALGCGNGLRLFVVWINFSNFYLVPHEIQTSQNMLNLNETQTDMEMTLL